MIMKRKILPLFLAFVMIIGVLAACSNNDDNDGNDTTTEAQEPATLSVFIAASLKNAMEEIKTEYVKDNKNITINFNADSSGTLQTQIKEGAECDIFFSAATKQMNELKEGGFTEDDSIVDLLENKVVLIKATGSDTNVTGFENITDAANLALAGEDVPVGAYARQIFENLGILDDVLAMEINQGANVTAVLTAVSEASNEVGVVYATDAASMSDSVEIIAEAPEGSLDEKVLYPVGLIKNSEADDNQTKAAEDFLKYLQSDKALEIFEKYGFSLAK